MSKINSVEKTITFNLKEISRWQLDSENSKIKLPALQRGFVWKVNQMESLWDSILRGFPIGSFLLSKHDNGEYDLLDGQQRATAIALGFYDPWDSQQNEKYRFWSVKNIPIIWIDLSPSEKTNTQKFVVRAVTQSHPWGYQRIDNKSILSVSDRRAALNIFRENPDNKAGGYIHLSRLNVFPYDADLPVPLPFLLKSIFQFEEGWRESLIKMCNAFLPTNLKTKHFSAREKSFIEQLIQTLYTSEFCNSVYDAISALKQIAIPAVIVKQEILKAEDEQTGEDPTLFVRLNSSGTKITGEELIYSIYKAAFPEAKELVEKISASFVAPSLVISLVSRIAVAEINGSYPYPINVNEFRKKIQDEKFRNVIKELIGTESNSPAAELFEKAFELLLSENDFAMPPVLVKTIVKASPDLLLLLLQWVKLHNEVTAFTVRRKILAAVTALSFFGRDNTKYVRESWSNLSLDDFWSRQVLATPYLNKSDFIMYPMIEPSILKEYLFQKVVKENAWWNDLNLTSDNIIFRIYKSILSLGVEQEAEIENTTKAIWDNFRNKLFWCKPLILFAQREYINKSFGEFNQMETLEDTNTPWDWDHIYPYSWVWGKWNINYNTRHWTNCIGNFRALSLEENRSQSNNYSPKKRLFDEETEIDVRNESFIKDDWEFWKSVEARINDGESEKIRNHLSAIVSRMCNIYEEWYSVLNVGELFGYESEVFENTL